MATTNPLNVPGLDWATVSSISAKPSEALEKFAYDLACDSAVYAVEAECGHIAMPESLEAVATNAGTAEAVGILEDYKAMLRSRIDEMRNELSLVSRRQDPNAKIEED